jgi:bacillithiol system protein YtxJ
MEHFHTTTNLSEIVEESQNEPVIIFKYSSECRSSERLSNKLEAEILEKKLTAPIYIVVVQKQPGLSKKISEYFDTQHETPQILVVYKNKVTYTAHHNSIRVENMIR